MTVENMIANISGVKDHEMIKKNRYCAVSKSVPNKVYCFSTPVFEHEKGKLVPENFVYGKDCYEFHGSNGFIRIYQDVIHFIRESDKIEVAFAEAQAFRLANHGKLLKSKDLLIYPTLNGILIKESIIGKHRSILNICSRTKKAPKNNSKYFALMKGKFEPLFTVNAMYAENRYGSVFYHAAVAVKKISEEVYRLELNANENAERIVYEMNLYEPKLFQDTTVESRRPNENNVYGGIAFLGNSPDCGTQLLYSRIDTSKLWDTKHSLFERVRLFVPYYMTTGKPLQLYAPLKRFCSFGSNWANRIQSSDLHIQGEWRHGFLVFDLSAYLLKKAGNLQELDGFVIQPNRNEDSFSVIATADNYFTPQILELTLKTKEK